MIGLARRQAGRQAGRQGGRLAGSLRIVINAYVIAV